MIFNCSEVGRPVKHRAQQQIEAWRCVNSSTIKLIRRWSAIALEIASSTVEVDPQTQVRRNRAVP